MKEELSLNDVVVELGALVSHIYHSESGNRQKFELDQEKLNLIKSHLREVALILNCAGILTMIEDKKL